MSRRVVGPTAKRRPSRSRDGPDAEQRVRHEQLVGAEQLRRASRSRSSARRPSVRARFEHGAAHDAFDAAARRASGSRARRPRTTKTLLLVPPTTWPLASSSSPCCTAWPRSSSCASTCSRRHRCLMPGERRILAEPQLADAHADPVAIVGVGILGPRRNREHARRCGAAPAADSRARRGRA